MYIGQVKLYQRHQCHVRHKFLPHNNLIHTAILSSILAELYLCVPSFSLSYSLSLASGIASVAYKMNIKTADNETNS